MRTITVVDYNPNWPRQFQDLRSTLTSAIGDIALAIEHVGSTAVPGLSAKPVIDIDVVVSGPQQVADAIMRLAIIGYSHRGDLGIAGREAFDSPHRDPAHHLYVCQQDALALRNHLTMRATLRTNPHLAREYGELKKGLATRFSNDIDGYIDGKTGFLLRLLQIGDFAADEIEAIRQANALNSTTAAAPDEKD